MRMRSVFLTCLLLASGFLGLSGSGVSADTWIIDANAPAGGYVFNSLEELRRALETYQIALGPNDVIELRNDDATLTTNITLAGGQPVKITSANGKRYTIGSSSSGYSYDGMVLVEGNSPSSTFENVDIYNSGNFYSAIESTNLGGGSGTLTLRNTLVESDSTAAIYLTGSHTVDVTNSILKGNTYSIYGSSSSLNVTFDSNASLYTHWDGRVSIGGSAVFDIASGKSLMLNNGISSGTITKNGEGTLKLASNSSATSIRVNEGTMQLMERSWTQTGGFYVASDAVFKPTITRGNLEEMWAKGIHGVWQSQSSRLIVGAVIPDPDAAPGTDPADIEDVFYAGSFISEEGARLEIGGISDMPTLVGSGSASISINAIVADVDTSYIASTLRIDNALLRAYFEEADVYNVLYSDDDDPPYYLENENGFTGYVLTIDRINNLDILTGVGHYADAYRRSELSEVERDMLDGIYARGGTAGSDLGFLQTVGGQIIQNSMIAMRQNQSDLITRINRRVTAYQKEELEANPFDKAESTDPDYYNECEEYIEYGQMWASLDQGWMSQRDLDNIAGYRFSNTTLTIGYDKHMDEWIYGGALSYATGDMKLKNQSGSRTDVKNLLAAVYASWARDGYYVSGTGVAGYGWNDSRSVYTLPGVGLSSRTGNYATNTLAFNLEFGYMMETDFYGLPVRFTPYGGLTYGRTHRQGTNDMGAYDDTTYNDTIDLRKKYGAGNWNTWESSFGARLSAPIEKDTYVMVPSLDLAWTRVTGSNGHKTGTMYMVKDPSVSWYVPLMSENRSAYRMIAGLDVHMMNGVTLSANYELEHRKDYWRNQLNVGMSMEF